MSRRRRPGEGRLRITGLKFVPPVAPGHAREYVACRQCRRVVYHDFVPYSFSSAVWVLPCGHGIGQSYGASVTTLDEQTGLRGLLEQEIERRAKA